LSWAWAAARLTCWKTLRTAAATMGWALLGTRASTFLKK
jgi:hypothetical protein